MEVQLNERSIDTVRAMIAKKNSSTPYMATGSVVKNMVTDYDHFPYTRWFRGVYYYPEPIIAEREAGWRPLDNSCYKVVAPVEKEKPPHHCFEAPCTTTFPCYPQYLTKYADSDSLDRMINNTCVVQYR